MTGKKRERSRRVVLSIEMSTFEIPPSGDVLVLGKRCAIGPQAAKRMLDTVSPGQFELAKLQDDLIDGILVRKLLFLRTDKDSLINAIIEESKAIMSDQDMIRMKCDVTVGIRREL